MNAPSRCRREPTGPAHGRRAHRPRGLRVCADRHGEHLLHRGAQRRAARDARDAGPKAPRFVAALQRIAVRYPTAKTIHLIMDNLNLKHGPGSFSTLGPVQGDRCGRGLRRTIRPSTAVEPAEIEASLWSRECHLDRVDDVRPSVIARAPGPRAPTERGER